MKTLFFKISYSDSYFKMSVETNKNLNAGNDYAKMKSVKTII